MAHATYAVMKTGSGWTIAHDGKQFGNFAAAEAAAAMAVETAKSAAAQGFEAKVLIEEAGGGFRVEWRSNG